MDNDDEEDYKCPICPKSFAEKKYLTKHVNRVHPDGQPKKKKDNSIQCPMCKKTFPRFSHVARHQLSCMNIRSFECPFCEDKFQQKPHLIRHVGRKHPKEDRSRLETLLASNDPSKATLQPSTSGKITCESIIQRHLCIKCGHVFTDKHDLMKHIRNLHHPLVCHHCNRIFYGNAALKKHEIMTRTAKYTCSCGASFSTIRILKNHENACRRRGEFMCVQDDCKQLFCQRIQLDRHWNKQHFLTKNCPLCAFAAMAPLKLSAHLEEQHQKKICGYCGLEDPDDKHVFNEHWRRLKKTISLVKKNRKAKDLVDDHIEAVVKKEPTEDIEDLPEETLKTTTNEELLDEKVQPVPKAPEFLSDETFAIEEGIAPLPSYEVYEDESFGALPEVVSFPPLEPTQDAVINLVIQVPLECTRLILSDHVSTELALTFPELKNSSVLITEEYQGRILSLFIPVSTRDSPSALKWTAGPIYL